MVCPQLFEHFGDTCLLVEDESGAIRRTWLDALADDVAMLRASNLYPLQSAAPAERHTGEVSGIEFVPVVRAARSVLCRMHHR